MRNDGPNLSAPAIALLAFGLWITPQAQGQLPPLGTDNAASLHTNLPTLTQAEQIRRLSLPEAQRHYPVKLRGIVLDYSSLPTLFIADDTGGIYVKVTGDQPLRQGQILEIEGVIDAGKFAPMVIPSSLRTVGEGRLPPPRDVTFQRISSGVEDSQWVRVTGIVRSTGTQVLKRKLKCPVLAVVTEDGGRLNVLVNDERGEPIPSLVDAEVAVTGIAESIYNGKRQLINVRLLAPGTNFIELVHPAPVDTLTAPARPIDSLRQFSTEKPSGHRVRVDGIVTLQQPGKCIFIQDKTGSVRVETEQLDSIAPGDRVEAIGFPAVYDYTPVLEDAVFHKVGTGPPVLPLDLTAREAQVRNHDADLICVNAQLLNQFRTPDQLILVLQEGDTLFRAQLVKSEAANVKIRDGARLQVTGICLAQFENYHSPRAFQMILRSPADLVVLHQPSPWTASRLRWALGILSSVLLGVGIWVGTLKRQVSIQTRAIREKIEREAVLQERMRIAREFHDSLEQELAGVRMQIELTAATVATAPGTAAASLQMARTMICHSQAEARRSVWELRSQILENTTLPAALSTIAGSLENGAPIAVNVSGRPGALPMRVESNLLRIAQEAITNAIKHAKPRHITVDLDYQADGARLKIFDDGCGFCVDTAPDRQDGHFGLLGMKERVDKIAGTLRITSFPGKGTRIEVFVPQNREQHEKR
jgi:signal transduction histidine kinase